MEGKPLIGNEDLDLTHSNLAWDSLMSSWRGAQAQKLHQSAMGVYLAEHRGFSRIGNSGFQNVTLFRGMDNHL